MAIADQSLQELSEGLTMFGQVSMIFMIWTLQFWVSSSRVPTHLSRPFEIGLILIVEHDFVDGIHKDRVYTFVYVLPYHTKVFISLPLGLIELAIAIASIVSSILLDRTRSGNLIVLHPSIFVHPLE